MVGTAEIVPLVLLVLPLTGTILVANGSIFAAYYCNTNLRTVDNYLFMFLCFANLMAGLCYPLQCMVDVGILNNYLACFPIACVLLVIALTITWAIVGLTMERYLNILHPFSVRLILTETRVLGIVCFILFYSVVTGAVVPPIISAKSWSNISQEVGTASPLTECRFYNLVPSFFYRIFYFANRVASIPLFFGIYLRIFLVARRHMRAIDIQVTSSASQNVPPSSVPSNSPIGTDDAVCDTSNTHQPERHTRAMWRRQIRLTLLVFAIALYHSICWIPHTFLILKDQSPPPPIYYTLTHFVTYSNTAIYPIIYGLGNRDFRKALANLFGCSGSSSRVDET